MYITMSNPSAHPSYSHYYLLSPSTLFFFFCTSCCFLHILLFLPILLSFAHLIVLCTSYCFALFFISLHILLLFLFFLPYVCPCVMLLYIICILIILHCPLSGPVRLHFTSNYTLYNYYVTNKETLNLDLGCVHTLLKKTSYVYCARLTWDLSQRL